MIDLSNKWAQWLTLAALALTWGSSFILMKKGLLAFGPQEVAAYRLSTAFLFMAAIGYKHWKHYSAKIILPVMVVGFLGNGIPAFLFTKAQTKLDSSYVGILNALVPLFTLIVGILFFQLRVRWFNAMGIILGLCGAFVLMYPNLMEGKNEDWSYALYPILATIFYAISVNTIKRYLTHLKSITITVLAFTTVGPWALAYLFFYTDFTSQVAFEGQALTSLLMITILGVVGTALAVLIFNQLVKQSTVIFASSVTYFIPVTAILWGFLDGEQIGFNHLAGISTILLGVYLVNKKF
jgi:drug/metabolite transporter (DMT)-like permease